MIGSLRIVEATMTSHSESIYKVLAKDSGQWKSLKTVLLDLGISLGSQTKIKKELGKMPGVEIEDRRGQKVRLWIRHSDKAMAESDKTMPVTLHSDPIRCKADAVKHLTPVVMQYGVDVAREAYLTAIDFLAS